MGPAGKRRPIIHSNSDEEDSEEEKEVQVAYEDGLQMIHGLLTRPKAGSASVAAA